MGNEIKIRQGEEKDVPFVCALEARVFSDPWGEDAVASHLTGGHLCLFVAECDGVLCGYLLASVIPPEGEILRVATLPEQRRRGVGAALCTHFLSVVDCAFLEVREGNLAARALYEKLGFSLFGERKGYYKNPMEDACLYRRG